MSLLVETVRVKHATLGYVLINKSDFVPGVHQLFSTEDTAEPVEPVHELSVAGLKAAIAEVTSLEELAIFVEAEQGRKDGGRKKALEALALRYEELDTAPAE
jgi:hypothetical protein